MATLTNNGRRLRIGHAAFVVRKHTPTLAAPTVVQSFGLTNWSSTASSPGFARQGVAFAKGAVPQGFAPAVQRNGTAVAAQFDATVRWLDGSLKYAVMHLRDAAFAASESRTYNLLAVPGGVPLAGTPRTLADITSARQVAVKFANLTEQTGPFYTTPVYHDPAGQNTHPGATRNFTTFDAATRITSVITEVDQLFPDNSVQRTDRTTYLVYDSTSTGFTGGSGALTASFAAAAAVPTRTEQYHLGAVCDGWTAWGMATDNTGNAPDAHLKVNWYADIWKNGDGSIYAVEIAGVVAQDWWSVSNKRLRSYDATLVDGTATIQAYAGVVHPYKSQWITCQNAGGNNRGRRHWLGGACPTLTYTPDKTAWVNAGVMPPLRRDYIPAVYTGFNSAVSYLPCRGQNQRENIDGTGGYEGRGVVPNGHSVAFMSQRPEDVATARIDAHAGLHVFYHYRSNNNRRRPGDSVSDLANTPVSMIMGASQGVMPPYDFTADGMPAPVHAYADGRSASAYQDNYQYPQGGGGAWSITTGDPSHAGNYSYFMYLLEGERYHLEATLDLATNCMHEGISDTYACRPILSVSQNGYAVNGAPAIQYDAIGYTAGSDRAAGWAINIIGSAAGIVPDAHVAARFIKRFNRQQGIFWRDVLRYMPSDERAAGLPPNPDQDGFSSPWMTAFITIGGLFNAGLTEDPDIAAYAAFTANLTIGLWEQHNLATKAYRVVGKPISAGWSLTNRYVARNKIRPMSSYIEPRGTYSASTGFVTMLTPNAPLQSLTFVDGDVFYVTRIDSSFNPQPTAPLVEGTPYYVVNASGNNLQLAATPGGTPLTWGADWNLLFSTEIHNPNQYLDPLPGNQSGGDDYPNIHRAALVSAARAGVPGATPALVAKALRFVGTAIDPTWSNWNYAP